MSRINGLQDYVCAAALLDKLTDGHDLNDHEAQILPKLEEAISTYEKECEQLKAFNIAIDSSSTPVQLLKDIMETLQLSTSDVPEIGNITVVSDVLDGTRPISRKMAFALAERFSMDHEVFMPNPPRCVSVLASTWPTSLPRNTLYPWNS